MLTRNMCKIRQHPLLLSACRLSKAPGWGKQETVHRTRSQQGESPLNLPKLNSREESFNQKFHLGPISIAKMKYLGTGKWLMEARSPFCNGMQLFGQW